MIKVFILTMAISINAIADDDCVETCKRVVSSNLTVKDNQLLRVFKCNDEIVHTEPVDD